MNQEQLKGNWKQIKGKLQSKWGKLTEDDLEESSGKGEVLIGKIVERYGIKKEEAAKKLDEFLANFDDAGKEMKSILNKVSDFAAEVGDKTADVLGSCQKFSKDKPMMTLGILMAAGVLCGMALSRNR